MSSPNSMSGSGGGLGQAASDLLKEMQKAQSEVTQLEQKQQPGGAGSANFESMLQHNPAQAAGGPQTVQAIEGTSNARVVDVLRQAQLKQAAPSTRIGATERTEETKLQKMLTGIVHGQDKMTKIMNDALSGRQFSSTELIAMQVQVYRFSQELDLTSKVVQQATTGVKQPLNTHV